MRQLPYVSSSAKASSLFHPVMKVAHKIIASLVVSREERSTISTLERFYAMAHPDDNLISHYGSFLTGTIIGPWVKTTIHDSSSPRKIRISLPSGDPTISPTGKSHCISSPIPSPKKKRKMQRVTRVAGRHHKILLPRAVPAHPIRLDTHPITNNIWINSNRAIPTSTLTIKISRA
ncbi:unnamed protein product [Lactuca saligna]|uniref:Uncharacterized protein n=1 Tax=Lactuca saligna TaxID=75948 RepID=A0AA35UWR6_LACSI|nr:unnamed protein product [Lactuca saligna]